MLRDGWNFHGDIAISLEIIACSYFGIVNKQNETILYASCIESYSFAEVMIELLRSKTNYSSEYPEIDSFVEKCKPYIGLNGNTIPKEIANHLFQEFRTLFGE